MPKLCGWGFHFSTAPLLVFNIKFVTLHFENIKHIKVYV